MGYWDYWPWTKGYPPQPINPPPTDERVQNLQKKVEDLQRESYEKTL
jgi:hypothetical protein